jgi:hypothetical protein
MGGILGWECCCEYVGRGPLLLRVHYNLKLSSLKIGVGNPNPEPDPDPQDPHVFGPPRSGSISQRYGSGSFMFLIDVLSGLKKCLQNRILTQKV